MTQVPTPEQGLRERVDAELERLRTNAGTNFSRYALTLLHPTLQKRQVRHGVWNTPKISLRNVQYRSVHAEDIGRLDNIAHEYYNDPRLWWVIAHVNRINNPLEDMEIGMVLIIPQRESVLTAIESGNPALFEAS